MIDNGNDTMNAQIWASAYAQLETILSKPSLDTWVSKAKIVAFLSDKILLDVNNPFAYEYIMQNKSDNNIYTTINEVLNNLLNQEIQLMLCHPGNQKEMLAKMYDQYENTSEQPARESTKPVEQPMGFHQNYQETKPISTNVSIEGNHNLNPSYTFENFVIGGSNRMAHAACIGVADNNSSGAKMRIYNPLFIYGGSGLGKTHLMHAVGNSVLKHRPDAVIRYVSSEQFTNELIESLKTGKNNAFREKYRNVDVLMIDDIQFLAGKDTTQEEFFHTFNTLKDSNKQIIITSDKPPKEIINIEDRLIGRFEQGLITDIQSPDYETRVAILRKKAEADHLLIEDEVFEYIAEHMKSNVRQLEGCLNRISLFSQEQSFGESITKEAAIIYLETIISPHETIVINSELIQQKVAEYYNIRLEDFKAKRRTKDIAFPRQIAMYLCREMTDLSLPKIGEIFGRDHTTVIHAHDKIEEDMRNDITLQVAIQKIKDNITGK